MAQIELYIRKRRVLFLFFRLSSFFHHSTNSTTDYEQDGKFLSPFALQFVFIFLLFLDLIEEAFIEYSLRLMPTMLVKRAIILAFIKCEIYNLHLFQYELWMIRDSLYAYAGFLDHFRLLFSFNFILCILVKSFPFCCSISLFERFSVLFSVLPDSIFFYSSSRSALYLARFISASRSMFLLYFIVILQVPFFADRCRKKRSDIFVYVHFSFSFDLSRSVGRRIVFVFLYAIELQYISLSNRCSLINRTK